MTRIGYLVPEFPGQTHAFFWREIQALAHLGVACELLSTRRPKRELIAHSWSQQAIRHTTYIWPLSLAGLAAAIGAILRAGPAGWWRALRSLITAEAQGLPHRLRLLGLLLASAQLVALSRRRGWQHLHVHSCADSANLAMFARSLGGPGYSVTLHGPLRDYGPNQAMKWRCANFGIVITHKLLAEVRATLGAVAPRRIVVAPMGVNTRMFERTVHYEPWRDRGPYRIFSCGRLNPCKGYEDLVSAVALLRSQGVDAKLRIAGADDAVGQYRARLEQMIRSLGIGESVALLGAVSEEIVKQELEAAHVFSLASIEEPLGVATMEAMSMSVPVVVTRQGGVSELVQDGVDGVLVEAKAPQDLARGLEFIARNPELAVRIALSGRQKVVQGFDSETSARAMVHLLRGNASSLAH